MFPISARSKRLLDAIDELSQLLLDDKSHHLRHETLLKKLKSLRSHIKAAQGKNNLFSLESFV